jgi:DNA-binding transcriptional ArsR family regulator
MDETASTSRGVDHELEMDGVWKALSDPTRRGILDLLRDGPRTTGDLVEAFPEMTRFGVMKHLGVLEEARLVLSAKQGRVKWNHLNPMPLRQIYERWVSKYEDQWAGSLTRLKRLAETDEHKE